MLDIKLLRTIKALHEEGSLTAAAERLHLTQSALSHQIRDLETWFGVSLFVRKSRPLRLTPAGQRLLELSVQVLPLFAATEQALWQLGRGQRGRLHMAIECHSCYLWLIPSINQYRGHWPDVELDFIGHWHLDALPALARGELDLVITSDPLALDEVVYVPLFSYEARLALSPAHALADQPCILPEHLRTQTLITYPVSPQRLDVFTRFLNPAGVVPAQVRTAEMTLMMAQLVASHRGVAVLPNWALSEYEASGLLTSRPLGTGGVWGQLYAAVRKRERDAPFMRAFLETLEDVSFRTLRGIRSASSREDIPGDRVRPASSPGDDEGGRSGQGGT